MGIHNTAHIQYPVVAIGGVGGSGTRVIASFLRDVGYYIGGDLNRALDNLWFSLLFRRIDTLSLTDNQFDNLIKLFLTKMSGHNEFSSKEKLLVARLATKITPALFVGQKQEAPNTVDWMQERANSFLSTDNECRVGGMWGWKEPNTHIVLEGLIKNIPDFKYIHMIRNGLDMAYSNNQAQLKLWGRHFLGPDVKITPHDSLRYWRIINERALNIGRSMGENFMLIDFDKFCIEPHKYLNELVEFIGIDVDDSVIGNTQKIISPPDSIGRYKKYRLEGLDEDDIVYAEALGFDVSIK